MLVKKAKEHLTVRVPSVVKRLIEIETGVQRALLGVEFSSADFVEMAIYRAATSPESRALLLAEIQQNAGVLAMLGALGVKIPIASAENLNNQPNSNSPVAVAPSDEAREIVQAAAGELGLLKPAPPKPIHPLKPVTYLAKHRKKSVSKHST